MARKALVWLLVLGLPLASPGGGGWLAFAEQVGGQYRSTGKPSADPALPPAAQELLRKLQDPALAAKLSPEEREQAIRLVQKYPEVAADPETAASLKQIAADLDDPAKDPAFVLHTIFDRFQNGARGQDEANQVVSVVSQAEGSQTLAVHDVATGRLLFVQHSEDIGSRVSRRTIVRQDPNTGQKVIDAIVDVDDNDAAGTQRVIYNRKVQEFVRTLKKFYFDQCPLVRKINNGDQPPRLSGTGCVNEGGTHDDKVGAKAIADMLKVYKQQQDKFTAEMSFVDSQGRPRSALDYLKELDAAKESGALDKLDWRDLMAVQRAAMRFYSANELVTLQKYVLIQLTSFLSQITNSQPKGDKEGVQDASLKENAALQHELDEIEKGHLQEYDMVMGAAIRAAHLSADDQKFIPKSLYDATGEAFAYLGYAVKTNVTHAFAPGVPGEEQDATIEEAQHWIKLAQIQLQTFEASTLAIQMERLKAGELAQHLGLTDDASKAQALKLAATARDVYLKGLAQESVETKSLLLRQAVSNFFQTLQNAEHAHLMEENVRERLRTLSAKAEEIRYLFLARQFERFKNRPEFQVRANALDRLENAPAYSLFLKKISARDGLDADLAKVAETADELQRLADDFKDVSKEPKVGEAQFGDIDNEHIREFLASLDGDLSGVIPTAKDLDDESKRLAVKWGHFNQAYQTFSSQIRMFDMVNELDLYVRKYMSSEMVSSESQGVGSAIASMKWMDWFYNKVNFGHRDDIAYFGMKNSPLASGHEAWEKLVANKDTRKQILDLMNKGDFNAAMELMAKLDPKAAERAAKEAAADKAEKDPFESLDFEASLVSQPDNDLAIRAQGSVIGCFQSLQSGILTYMAAAGVMDMVTTTVLTAGMGQFAKVFGTAARITAAVADAMEGMKIVEAGEGLSMMARAWNLALSIGKGVFGYGSRMLTAWGNNAKNIAAAKEVATAQTALKQLRTNSLIQAALRTVKTTATITGASVVMSVGQHVFEGKNSQFRSAGDAALQGAVGGLSFGGKAGLLFMFSPIQSTAMGNGAIGRIMTNLAETPGPISAVSSFVAKVVPEWAEGTVARQGLLGKLVESAMEKSVARQLATRTAVFGGGMLDGMLKFTLIAEVPKWVVEGSSMFGPGALSKIKSAVGLGGQQSPEAASAEPSEPADGMTPYMRKLTGTQNLGMDVAQMSWLVLPMQAMQGTTEDMHNQMDQMYGFNRALAQGKGIEFEGSPNNVGKVEFERPWYYRLFNRENPFKQTGRKGEVDVRSEFKKAAVKSRLEKSSLADVVANAMARPETQAGVRDASVLIDGLVGGKARAPSVAEAAAAPTDAERVGQALDELPAGAEKGRLFAYFDKDGKLEKVSVKPEPGRVGLEFDVTRDGQATLAHGADGRRLTPGNKAAAGKLAGHFERAEAAFRQAVSEARASVMEPAGGKKEAASSPKVTLKPGQWFVTNESVEAANEVLGKRLEGSPEMRRQLLRAKADPLEFLGRDSQARSRLLEASGGSVELRDDQTGFTYEIRGETFKKLQRALREAGGDVSRMLDKDPRLAPEVKTSKEVSASFVLRDGRTGESVKLGGKALEDVRHMAEWHELNTRSMSAGEILRSAVFGDEGGHSPFEGRIWKIITGRKLSSKSQIFTAELQAAAADRLEAMGEETPAQRMSALQKRVEALRDQGTAGDAKVLEPLRDALAQGDLSRAKRELLALSGGVEPAQLLELKRGLSRDAPAAKKIAEGLKTVKGWGDGEAARRLEAALSKGEPEKAVDAGVGVIDEVTRGHTLETLDNISLRLDGKVAADDIIEAVHEEMGRRIAAATGDQKLAMEDLRGTLESDAFLRLANDKAVEAITDFKSGDAASRARLEEAKRLLVGTWERGVFGQKYVLRVEKTDPITGKKTMKWEVPAEHQFSDVNGNSIPSFRQHQREAIEQDLELIATGKKRMYDLMKTSGGKTLLGFVLVNFLEKYAQSRGREGVFYVTTDAGLVAQTRDNYLAMFKGRKPSFEIIDYSELFLREAMAKQMGTLSPWASHDVYADELDQVGLGTPLSLGKFNGALTHTAIDPVQKVIQTYAEKAGLARSGAKDKDGRPVVCSGLCAKYSKLFDHQRLENPEEFEAFLRGDSPEAKAHPKEFEQFRKDWSDLNSAFSKAFREARAQVESRAFIDQIPQAYADKKGLTRAQVRAELLKEYDNAFGNWHHVGVFEAKYGGNPQWLSKVLKGSYMAGTYGEKLDATYKRDPDREAIVSIVNDQALESLDTFQRTALEAREGVPITLDFENAVVVNFRDLLEAARRNDAALVAASGTQPAEEETFLQKLGVKTVGEGSPIDKVEKMPHQFIMKEGGQIPYIVSKFKELMGQQGPKKLNPDTGKPAKNIAVVWAPDDAAAAKLLDALKEAGVSQDRVSIRMTPGSSFFLQERYKLGIKASMNDEGLRAGAVDVALMVGQGGFRGHEMPLQAYNGGEIKMFVMDSASLTDVGAIQLSGRIDRGRVPKSAITTFELLDEFNEVASDRYYKRDMPGLLEDAIDGRQLAQLARLKSLLKSRLDGALEYNDETRDRLMREPGFADERKTYRDYVALTRLREAIGEARLSELSKLKRGDPKRGAAVESLLGDEKVASTLVIELRRLNEKRALQSSGVSQDQGEGERRPGLLDNIRRRFSGFMPGSRSTPAPAPAS